MDTTLIMLILTFLVASAFFSGIEIAYLAANKLQIELQGKQGILSGRIFAYLTKKTSYFIGTTLVGNTISLVLYGIFMAQLIEPELRLYLPEVINTEVSILICQTLLSTLLVLFTAEFLPKSIFLINPNQMLAALAVPFMIIYIILFPFVFFIVNLSRLVITYVFGMEYSDARPVFGLIDLNNYVKNMKRVKHEDNEIDLDAKIFHNALEFKSVRVRECMIPRTEIVAIAIDEDIETLKEAFVESGHSKIIIYREAIDDVIGYCHSSELFKKPKTIEEILTPILIVPETTMANELMIKFINQRKSLAVVIDEFGGTSGIVSMEDVIEEIFGEIEDEHDEDDLIEQKIDDKTYLFSARLEVDYLNEKYNWQLATGEYETLSGLLIDFTEDIPDPGEKIFIPPYTFIVQSTLDNRIDVVKMILEG